MNLKLILRLTVIFSLGFIWSCAPMSNSASNSSSGTESPQGTDESQTGPQPEMKICSKLDIAGMQWPAELTSAESTYYALGLNITGSFEGHSGWQNLTGNFDGQGISMGLLQQNLGQGSLQPLWIQMLKSDKQTMQSLFSTSQFNSLKQMLETWSGASIQSLAQPKISEELFPDKTAFNALDIGFDDSTKLIALGAKETQSVLWAQQNAIDTAGNILSTWKTPLQKMAGSTTYRSLQAGASKNIFIKARGYFQTLKFTELRFLLLMFDIVVQNGSIGSQHLAIYQDWLKTHPGANEEERALALLEARLTSVRDEYKEDVRSRKTAIIKSVGVVHKAQRNLSKEYCYNPQTVIQRP